MPSRYLGSGLFFDMMQPPPLSLSRYREVSRAEMEDLRQRHGGVALFETSSAEDPESVGAAFAAALKEGLALKVVELLPGSSHPKNPQL